MRIIRLMRVIRLNRTKTLKELYEKNENEKKDEYLERVLNVEKATFTPAVFLTSGGMSNECKQFINRLADLIARKRKERYSEKQIFRETNLNLDLYYRLYIYIS